MKSTSFFFTFRKILLAGAVLLCVSPASADVKVEIFRTQAARSHDFVMGALTLDNVYGFDFATAGIGTVVFRTARGQFKPFVINQELPRAVERWASIPESSSLIRSNFIAPSGFSHNPASFAAFENQLPTDPTAPVVAAPEASTWLSGALALVAIVFARRRRLLQRLARP